MSDRPVEEYALKQLWATMRQSWSPELTSALAKDKSKRADAAVSRLVGGYDQLPAVRAAFAPRYESLLTKARALAGQFGITARENPVTAAAAKDNPLFIGIPGVGGEIEALMRALANSTNVAAKQAANELVREVMQVEAACRLDYEARMAKLTPPPPGATDRDIGVATMQSYLRAHPRGSPKITVRKVSIIPGGRSKRTVIVELDEPGPLPKDIVLRLDTGRGTGTTVIEEFPMIDRVSKAGLPVPEPLWLESSSDVVGNPFLVFRRSPGSSAGDLIEGAFRKEPATARALARVVGQVHGGGKKLLAPSERGSSVPHTRALLSYYLDYWNSKKPFASLTLESAFIWLFDNIEGGLGEASVVQADCGFHNLLLEESGDGTLLDWEFAHWGDPAEDLASCKPAVERCMPWKEFMAEYQAHGGSPVTDFQLKYWEIWRPLRNVTVCGTVLHSVMNGIAEDIDPVTIGLSTFQKLQADLARSLAAVV